jgi:hypothetical protein
MSSYAPNGWPVYNRYRRIGSPWPGMECLEQQMTMPDFDQLSLQCWNGQIKKKKTHRGKMMKWHDVFVCVAQPVITGNDPPSLTTSSPPAHISYSHVDTVPTSCNSHSHSHLGEASHTQVVSLTFAWRARTSQSSGHRYQQQTRQSPSHNPQPCLLQSNIQTCW